MLGIIIKFLIIYFIARFLWAQIFKSPSARFNKMNSDQKVDRFTTDESNVEDADFKEIDE